MPNASRVYVLDTGVLVEYLDKLSPLAKVVESLFEQASKRRLTLYTTSLVLAETLYVASRFYRAAGLAEPNEAASDYIAWLKWSVGLKVRSVDEELALSAGELKKRLGIALTDCSVIACALEAGGIPLFRKVEREMERALEELRSLGARFLSELPPESL